MKKIAFFNRYQKKVKKIKQKSCKCFHLRCFDEYGQVCKTYLDNRDCALHVGAYN